MATLLKGKDAQRNPQTGLELGICSATIPNLNPPFTLAHNIMPPGYRSSTHSHTKVCRGTYRASGKCFDDARSLTPIPLYAFLLGTE